MGSKVPEKTSKRIIPAKPKRPLRSMILVVASYVVSALILGWSCWVPIQAVRSDTGGLTGGRLDVEERVQIRRTNAEVVRRDAIELDARFMDQVRENRRARTSNKPTSYESKQWLQNRIRNVKRQVKELGDPVEGTIQWDYKQHLIESLEDT